MNIKILSFILAIGFLSACEQLTGSKNDSGGIQQVPDPIPVPPPPPPLPHPAPPPPILNSLPDVSFSMDEWYYDGSGQVALEISLSKASAVPVSVDVVLIEGTALYPEDYIGFEGSSANDLKITVDIPENTIKFTIPPLLILDSGNCDVEFTATLNKDTVQQATITKDKTKIKLPCN